MAASRLGLLADCAQSAGQIAGNLCNPGISRGVVSVQTEVAAQQTADFPECAYSSGGAELA